MRFTIAMLLVSALLPFVFLLLTAVPSKVTLARWGQGWDNRNVWSSIERLDGWRRRAHLAQLNAHEAFPPFAVGMLLAQLTGVSLSWVRALSLGFLGFRLLHGGFYVAGQGTLRSSAWVAASLCTLGLFLAALLSAR
jgi:uncharacterized MAPEG superfamily protein